MPALQAESNQFSPIDENGTSKVDHLYSKAYLKHLMASNELLGKQIASIHNLAFYLHLMINHNIETLNLLHITLYYLIIITHY